MIGCVAPFDRVRSHVVVVLRFLEDGEGSVVEGVVDLNIGRVGDVGRSLRAVNYLLMCGTKPEGLSLLMRIGILWTVEQTRKRALVL